MDRCPPSQERRPKQEDLRIVPAGVDDPQFPVLLTRNRGRDAVRDQDRGDLFRRGRGLKRRWRQGDWRTVHGRLAATARAAAAWRLAARQPATPLGAQDSNVTVNNRREGEIFTEI